MNLGQPNKKFADLLTGAKLRSLHFPGTDQSEGPFWNEEGDVIEQENGLPLDATLLVVDLGAGKFRLAENPCFDDLTTLFWGDEFYATETQSGELQINKIALPLKFKHQTSIVGGKIDANSEYLNKIVESGGNWELIAGGFLITSEPVEVLKE
jgi:hypothetical protein